MIAALITFKHSIDDIALKKDALAQELQDIRCEDGGRVEKAALALHQKKTEKLKAEIERMQKEIYKAIEETEFDYESLFQEISAVEDAKLARSKNILPPAKKIVSGSSFLNLRNRRASTVPRESSVLVSENSGANRQKIGGRSSPSMSASVVQRFSAGQQNEAFRLVEAGGNGPAALRKHFNISDDAAKCLYMFVFRQVKARQKKEKAEAETCRSKEADESCNNETVGQRSKRMRKTSPPDDRALTRTLHAHVRASENVAIPGSPNNKKQKRNGDTPTKAAHKRPPAAGVAKAVIKEVDSIFKHVKEHAVYAAASPTAPEIRSCRAKDANVVLPSQANGQNGHAAVKSSSGFRKNLRISIAVNNDAAKVTASGVPKRRVVHPKKTTQVTAKLNKTISIVPFKKISLIKINGGRAAPVAEKEDSLLPAPAADDTMSLNSNAESQSDRIVSPSTLWRHEKEAQQIPTAQNDRQSQQSMGDVFGDVVYSPPGADDAVNAEHASQITTTHALAKQSSNQKRGAVLICMQPKPAALIAEQPGRSPRYRPSG